MAGMHANAHVTSDIHPVSYALSAVKLHHTELTMQLTYLFTPQRRSSEMYLEERVCVSSGCTTLNDR
jgi:hypothetical protein